MNNFIMLLHKRDPRALQLLILLLPSFNSINILW